MSKFNFVKTDIPEVQIIEPTVFGDDRGYFMETYQIDDFAAAGIDKPFVQDNQSRSTKGVLRGLHFQTKHTQGKLVRVTMGEVFDVAVFGGQFGGAGALLQRDALGVQLLGATLAHFQQDVPHHTAFQQGLDALLGACLFCFILNGRNQTHAAAASQTNFDTQLVYHIIRLTASFFCTRHRNLPFYRAAYIIHVE